MSEERQPDASGPGQIIVEGGGQVEADPPEYVENGERDRWLEHMKEANRLRRVVEDSAGALAQLAKSLDLSAPEVRRIHAAIDRLLRAMLAEAAKEPDRS